MPQRPTYQPLESASRFDDLSFNQTVEDGLADLRLPSLMDSGFASLRSLASPPEPERPRPVQNRLPMVSAPMPMLPLRRPSNDLLNEIDPEAPRLPATPSGSPQAMPTGQPASMAAPGGAPTVPATAAMPQGAPGSKQEKQARVYQASLENGLDDEGARILVAVTETEGGLEGAIGDLSDPRGKGQGSRGPFQFFEGGQMPGFRAWVREQGIPGDPNDLVHDVDLATRYAATTYLGQAIKSGRAQGLTGVALATYVQKHGQVSIHPERTGANYLRMFGQGPPATPSGQPAAMPSSPAGGADDTIVIQDGSGQKRTIKRKELPSWQQSVAPGVPGNQWQIVEDGRSAQSAPAATPAQASEAARTAAQVTRNQGDVGNELGLPWARTLEICGPVAAAAFLRARGRLPGKEEAEAMRVAQEKGYWKPGRGMGGPDTQSQLLTDLGVANRLEKAVDWQKVAADAQRGNPVIIDTADHYFVVEGYNSQTGQFNFGQSAAFLKASGGRTWFKPDEIPGLGMGAPRSTIYLDNPETPAPSVVAGRVSLNAAGAPSSAAVPLPTAGADGLAPIGPGSPLDDARATQQSDELMMRGPLQPYPELPADAPPDPSSFGAPEAPMLQSPIIPPNVSPVPPILPTSTVGAPFGPASDPTLGDPTYTQAPAVVPPPIRRSSAVDDPAVRTFDDPGTMPLPTPQVRAFDDPGQRPLIAPPPSPYAPGQAESMEPQPNRFTTPEPTVTQQAAAGLKPVWDAGGAVVGYVQEQAPALGARLGEDASRVLSNPLAPLQGTEINRRAQESAREIGQPIDDVIGQAGRGVEAMFGTPEGSGQQAILDASSVIAPMASVGNAARRAVPTLRQAAGGAVDAASSGPFTQLVRTAEDALAAERRYLAEIQSRGAPSNQIEAVLQRIAKYEDELPRLRQYAQHEADAARVAQEAGGAALPARATAEVVEDARPLYSPTPPPGTTRRYTGTANKFDAADPSKFDEHGLYGPGYYTTSDARVAGSYAVERGTPNAVTAEQARAHLQGIAARTRQTGAKDADALADAYETVAREIPAGKTFTEDQVQSLSSGAMWRTPKPISFTDDVLWGPAREARDTPLIQATGSNVRAIDIPPGVNMLDVDAPFDQGIATRVLAAINQLGQKSPEIAAQLRESVEQVTLSAIRQADDAARLGGPPPTNGWLVDDLMAAATRIPGMGKGLATEILERAGFHGIAHKGGQRVPMFDDAGKAIEHDVSVIFTGAVDKIRNAFSGTYGGGLAAVAGRVLPPAAAAGGAALVADEALAAEEGAEGSGGGTPYGPIAAGVATAALVALAATPQGRRAATQLARRAAANLKAAPTGTPANALEIAQGYRHSVGMLGNVATGLMNAASGPVELGLGLPTEVIRTGVLRGRPAAVIYEAAELSRGLAQDSRAFVRTALGFIDPAIRAAPDFRPPLAERMQGPAARAVGYAIDTPGRINTQAFDAFFHSAFTRWGRAREAAHLLEEAGVSRLRPDEQVATMNRWLNNPSAQDIADGIPERLAGGAKAFADELTYKGEAGFIEGKLGAIFRSGKTPTTAADPAAEQVWDLAGSLIQPFFHTLFKIQKLSASRVPVTGMLTNRSLPMDEKISRQIVGAALGLYIADRASQGLVTGPGPSDSDQAALVNKESPPESFFVPGVGWLPNSLAGSAGPQLSAIGAYYDARRYATDKEKESGWRMGERTAKDVMRAFADFPTAAGLQLLVGMAESPAKGVTDFVAGLGSQVMPAPARAYIAGQDPFTRTTDRDVDPPEMLGQKLVSRTGYVPGLGSRQDLPVAQDRFGRPVENPRQGWAAFFPNIKRSKGDPIAAVFIDAGVEPGMPKTEVTVVPGAPPIPLTSAEQRRWQTLRGAPLIENVPNVSASQAFQEADPASRKAALERMMAATGSAADKQLIAEIGPEVVRRRLEAAVSRKQRGR